MKKLFLFIFALLSLTIAGAFSSCGHEEEEEEPEGTRVPDPYFMPDSLIPDSLKLRFD